MVASGKLDVVYEEAEIIIYIQRQCMYSDQHTKLHMSAIAAYGGLTVQTLSPMIIDRRDGTVMELVKLVTVTYDKDTIINHGKPIVSCLNQEM